jgi:hypothetical protein
MISPSTSEAASSSASSDAGAPVAWAAGGGTATGPFPREWRGTSRGVGATAAAADLRRCFSDKACAIDAATLFDAADERVVQGVPRLNGQRLFARSPLFDFARRLPKAQRDSR